jgi:hypothetical protein
MSVSYALMLLTFLGSFRARFQTVSARRIDDEMAFGNFQFVIVQAACKLDAHETARNVNMAPHGANVFGF